MMNHSLQGQYGGFLSRLFGFFADVILIGLTNLFLFWLVSALLTQFTGFALYACPASETINLKIMTCRVTSWGYSAFLTGFPLGYMLFFWILTGQTLGHYAAGLRVIRTDGHRVNLVSGCIRFFGYFLCILSLGLGFLWILVDDRRQGWHDKLAGTCVIYAWEARQNRRFLHKLNQHLFDRTQHS
jgi:uncharacterized RDD family membrane protein YckC